MPQSTADATTARPIATLDPAVVRRGPHPTVLGMASGLLLAMAFDPVGAWWLAWVGLVPLLMLIRSGRSAAMCYFGSWVGGLTFWLVSVEWVRSSDPSAWPGWLALALVLSFWWPAALLLIRAMVRGLKLPLMIAAPSAWVGAEYVRGLYPLNGFPWFTIGQSTDRLLPLIQIADLAGAWLLGFLVLLVNAWLVDLWELPRTRPGPKGRRPSNGQVLRASVVALALSASLIYGVVRLRTAHFEAGPTLALIQSDIDQVFGGGPSQREILAIFRGLVDRAARDRPDLIVWPETMFPHPWIEIDPRLKAADFDRQVDAYSPGDDPRQWSRVSGEVRDLLRNWTDHAGVPMLVGINSYLFRPEGLARHNSALLLEPGSEATQAYHKLHLVPFGEYVPLVDTVPAVLALTPFDADHLPSLDPGPGPESIRVGPWRFAVAICFEDSVPRVTRALVRPDDAAGSRPADVLLNLSNDGWFRGTAAHRLHLANSVLRAVELRVPVARAVNTGISALIDGNGRVLESLPAATPGVLSVDVPLDPRSSLYAQTGDWLPIACLALSMVSLVLAPIRARHRSA